MERSVLCRSRREFSNAYFVAKFGFDTAENEPSKICPLSSTSTHPGALLVRREGRGRRPAAGRQHDDGEAGFLEHAAAHKHLGSKIFTPSDVSMTHREKNELLNLASVGHIVPNFRKCQECLNKHIVVTPYPQPRICSPRQAAAARPRAARPRPAG